VLAYLSRYTHRIAIANSRLVAFDGTRVTFKWKDYRAKADARYKLMTLDANEFIGRFLIHVLPDGFHRIRHYGLFANANRAGNIALARRLLGVPDPAPSSSESDGTENRHEDDEWNACPCCGGRMVIVETFEPGCQPRLWPIPSIGLDSS
jgi:Putative transposase